MVYAHIKDGICINIMEFADSKKAEKMKDIICGKNEDFIIPDDGFGIGDLYNNGIWKKRKNVITAQDIDNMVVDMIRKKYTENDEYKMLRLGISDPQNALFVEYNEYVHKCIEWGREEKAKLGV